MRGNLGEYRAVARALRSLRAQVDGDTRHLRSAGAAFESWLSPASEQFNSYYYTSSFEQYAMVTRDLDDFAAMLENAATQLEDAIARTYAIESRTETWFWSQPPPEDGSPPMWEQQGWVYRPGRLPTSGDSEWFAVERYLRNLGVGI